MSLKKNTLSNYISQIYVTLIGIVILPGVTREDGVAVAALSLVNRNCEAFGIHAGNPARRVKERKRDLLDLEQKLRRNES